MEESDSEKPLQQIRSQFKNSWINYPYVKHILRKQKQKYTKT